VRDELEQLAVRHVDRQHHAVFRGLRERAHTLGDEVEHDVRLLECRVRGVEDQRDFLGDLEVEFLREIEVRALGGVDHALQRGTLLFVEIHVEVRGVIDAPFELVIDDLVLTERVRGNGRESNENEEDDDSLQESLLK
jgi:hypothetical protein